LVGALLLGAAARAEQGGEEVRSGEPERPHIVLILADDLGWSDSGPYGNRDVRTPNLDRLAAEGLTFERAFTCTAMCAPSRQALYTGLFPVRNGAYTNHGRVRAGTRSLVHHLGALGYRVGLLGKKHFGPPESFPFETVTDPLAWMQSAGDERPFCLVFASKEPHVPWTRNRSAYDPAELTLPPVLVDNAETRQKLAAYYGDVTAFDAEVGRCLAALEATGREERTLLLMTSEHGPQLPGAKWTCYDYGQRTGLIVRWPGHVTPGRRTRAMVQYVDVLPTLIDAAGGDPFAADTGVEGALGGGRGFDGRSFLGVLRGESERHAELAFGVHTTTRVIDGVPYPVRSVRDERWKLIRNLLPETAFQDIDTQRDPQGYWKAWLRDAATDPKAARLVERYLRRPAVELYDLESDPFELDNLAADPAQAERIEALGARLDAWMSQQGDEGVATELRGRLRRKRGEREDG
jgi:uncharacterized sulfatase